MQITRNSLETTRRSERLVHRRGLPRLRRRALGSDSAEREPASTSRPARAPPGTRTRTARRSGSPKGVGLCQRRGGPVEVIRPGDRVFFEPGEEHWHGAAATRFMTHLAMRRGRRGGPPGDVGRARHRRGVRRRSARRRLSTLPFDEPGARIAFDVVVGAFVLSELTIRLRSERNRAGSRLERTSLLVVQATAMVGVGGAILLTRRLPGAAVAGGRWPLFVAGLVLMCAGIAIRQWAVVDARPLLHDRRPGAARPDRRRPRSLPLGAAPLVHRVDPDLSRLRPRARELGGAARWRFSCRPPAWSTASTSRSAPCSRASASRTGASPRAAGACFPACGDLSDGAAAFLGIS